MYHWQIPLSLCQGQGAQGSTGISSGSKKRDVSDIENNEEPGPSNKQLRTSWTSDLMVWSRVQVMWSIDFDACG